MLVRFFLRRPGRPSIPNKGEEIEEGLGSMLSTAMVSAERDGKREKEQKRVRNEYMQANRKKKLLKFVWNKKNKNKFSVICI